MLRYGRGELAAFQRIYARHKDPMYRYLLRGTGNPAVAQDLSQDVWARVVEARARYVATARFTTWLYAIAHNRLTDHWRHSATRSGTTSDEEVLVAVAGGDAVRPDTQAADADCVELLQVELAKLPAEQRELILLREEGQMSLEEMAAVQGVGRETAKSRLRYALAKLKEALDDCL